MKREKVVKRTTSDPGQGSSQLIQFQGETFALAYQHEDGYLSPSLQDEVFSQVQDFNDLSNIQFQTESLLPEQNSSDMQDITSTLDDYTSLHDAVSTSPFHQSNHSVNQDLQAVLNSPLPESLAEFSTFHSSNNLSNLNINNLGLDSPPYQTSHSPGNFTTGSPHTLSTVSPLQSPLIRHDSPGFAYPTPPASHEGQSPFNQTILPMVSPKQEFGHVIQRDIDEPPQASSPLSAAFFTSTMSSSAAVEEALEEVLPGESITGDELYPLSNSPQSPLHVNLTPVHSPLHSPSSATTTKFLQSTSTANTTNAQTQNLLLQPNMLRGPDDPLLSQTSKEFNRFKTTNSHHLTTIKDEGICLQLQNGVLNHHGPLLASGSVTISTNQMIDMQKINILVDAGGGEFKILQGAGLQHNSIILTGTPLISPILKTDDDVKVRYHKLVKSVHATPLKVGVKTSISKFNIFDNIKQEIKQEFKQEIKQEIKQEVEDVFLSPTT